MIINTTTYNKRIAIPYDPDEPCGYQPRPAGTLKPRSIIVHTTNGRHGSTLASEARYIMNSREISAHYLIGKHGEIIQFLDPVRDIAYHAGCVKAMLYSNVYTIGIEIHNTPTEGHITTDQQLALTTLVEMLMNQFNIPRSNIETHRAVAIFCKGHKLAGKLGRKIDPSGFPNEEFYPWRETLNNRSYRTFRVTSAKGVNIRQSPQVNDHNIAGTLNYNDTFMSDVIKIDELNQTINGSNKWAHILKGTSNGMSVDQLGFVHLSNLQEQP